jgi:orotidine-5'-phosphate decarboxylase
MTELILALDLTGEEEAVETARACAPYIDAIKIGYPLVLPAGLRIAGRLADIPNTNRLISEAVFAAGFDAVICQGFTGADAILACTGVARDHGGSCYVVAEMSHPGATEFFSAGVGERIAKTARACGADGIIAPATRPERIRVFREIVGEMKILSPGVGAQGGDLAAAAALADGIIVGRSIYGAPDPAAAAREYSGIRR